MARHHRNPEDWDGLRVHFDACDNFSTPYEPIAAVEPLPLGKENAKIFDHG